MFKKTLAWLLALCMVLTVVPVSAFATEGSVTVTNTNTNTSNSGSSTTETEPEGNNEPAPADLEIGTAEALQAFAAAVTAGDNFADKIVRLVADIDLAGIEWSPIGGWDGSVQFCGEFDGNGKKIENLTVDSTNVTASKYRLGLFADLGKNAFVHDITFVDTKLTLTSGQGGALAGRSGASLKNVTVDGITVNSATGTYAGGVVGITNYYSEGDYGFSWDNVDAKNVSITFTGTTGTSYGGGLLGGMNPNGARLNTYENCDVTNITILDENVGWHGGMWGWHGRSGAFSYVKNSSVSNVNITTKGTGESRVGGICGFVGVSGGVFENVSVNGGSLVAGGGFAGGFTPWAYAWGQDTFNGCKVSNVDVTCSTGVAAGFVAISGAGNQAAKCVDCAVEGGTVTGRIASGFAGKDRHGNAGGAFVLYDCSSSATVNGTEYAAGIIANSSSSYVTVVSGCEFSGTVTGPGKVSEGIISEHTEAGLVASNGTPIYYAKTDTADANPAYVAVLGQSKAFTSFTEAIAAANAVEGGATVTLLADVTLGEVLTITGNVTISGGSIAWADGYTGTLFNIASGANLTLKNVTIDGENAFTFYDDTTTVENGQNWYTRFVDVGEEDKAINANVIVNAGNLTLDGVEIKNVTIASDSGNGKTENTETGGYYLKYNDDLALIKSTSGTVNINNSTITGNAGMVLNADNTTTKLVDSKINGNMFCGRNGGGFDLSGGSMTITDTEINGNKGMARCATIIGVTTGANVVMEGVSTINNNEHLGVGSNTAGAMIVVREGSTFTMNGGSICNNVGGRAGAIASRFATADANVVLNAGAITGNTASKDDWSGASVFLRSPATIGDGMTVDGTIVVNAAPGELEITGGTFNGGLIVTNGLTAEISGGTFNYDPSDWTVIDLGVVYNETDGTYTITDDVYKLWFRDPTTHEQLSYIGPLESNNPASLVATGKLFYADYYEMELEVLANAKIDEPIVIDYPMTVNLNGHTLTGVDVYPVIRVQGGANVTVKGDGTITNGDYVFVLGASDGSSVGNLTIENGKYHGATTVASVTKGTLTVNGGEFSVEPYEGSYEYLLNCIDANYKDGSAKILVNGGRFYGFNPANNASEGANTNYLPIDARSSIYGTVDGVDVYDVVVLKATVEAGGITYYYPGVENVDSIQELTNYYFLMQNAMGWILGYDYAPVITVYGDVTDDVILGNTPSDDTTVTLPENITWKVVSNGFDVSKIKAADDYVAIDNGDGTYTFTKLVASITFDYFGSETVITCPGDADNVQELIEFYLLCNEATERFFEGDYAPTFELYSDVDIVEFIDGIEEYGWVTDKPLNWTIITNGYSINAKCEDDYIVVNNADGTLTVMPYVNWVQQELLAGNDVVLDRDIVITDYDLVHAHKWPSNGNGKYDERHGNGAIFHIIKPGVELDLNGHSITWDAHSDDYCNKRQVSLFMVTITGNAGEPADFTVVDSKGTGKVEVYGMGTGMYVVGVDAVGTIAGGTWTNYPCNTCDASNIFIYPSHGGTLEITGGTFEQKDSEYLIGWNGSSEPTTNNGVGIDQDQTKVVISGGIFVNFNPEEDVKFIDTANGSAVTPTNGCAENFAPKDNGDGTYTVKPLVTVEFNSFTHFIGDELPEFTYTTNFTEVAEDGMLLVVGKPEVTINGVGEYEITAEAYVFMSDAYVVRVTPGKLTVVNAVASIGTTKYASLAEAIEKAKDGDTVVLLKDIDLADVELVKLDGSYDTYFLVEGKSITVDLNGKTISGAYTGSMLVGVFSTDKNGHLTLTGNGTVDVTATGKVYCLITAYSDGSSITIENGTYTLDKASDSLIYYGGKTDAALTVEGGTFTLGNVGTGENGKPWIFNVLGAGDHHALVTGGTFNADINRQHWSNEAVVDKTCYVVNNGDGTWTVKEGAVAYVATGMLTGPYFYRKDVGYATIEEAIAAAVTYKDGNITLLQNVALTKDVEISIPGIILNTNGYTLDCNGHKIILTAADATLTAPEGLNVTTNVENLTVNYVDGTYVVVGFVAKNESTGATYATLADALAAAKAGETVKLLANAEESILMIPAGVTLNLNGNYITAGNVLSFGNVIDNNGTTDGLGGINITNDRTKALVQLQKDNTYLPLYDAANGCYRFYSYEVMVLSNKVPTTDAVTFRYRIRLSTAEAYRLLADSANSGIEFNINVSWTGLENADSLIYNVSGDKISQYANEAYEQVVNGEKTATKVNKTIEFTIFGLDAFKSGTVITATPSFSSMTGVVAEKTVQVDGYTSYTYSSATVSE
ncbi:MAG: hypothetical protein J6A85_04195 [Clostridia bacterium]|nr:hypothetical protein [Clostridia bacterium]